MFYINYVSIKLRKKESLRTRETGSQAGWVLNASPTSYYLGDLVHLNLSKF